jgi:hypothetical protein
MFRHIGLTCLNVGVRDRVPTTDSIHDTVGVVRSWNWKVIDLVSLPPFERSKQLSLCAILFREE